MTFRKVRVVFLVRDVGPTSMPWNDLYPIARRISPGTMYPPAVVGFPFKFRAKISWKQCNESARKYLLCNPLSVLNYLWRLYRNACSNGELLIVHIHNPLVSLVGFVAKLFFPQIKIVANLHTDWSCLLPRHKLGLHLLATISNRFISVSEASQNSIPFLLRERLKRNGQLVIIHNGIDPKKIGCVNVVRETTHTETVAIVVARMVTPKNHSFILQLFAKTPELHKLVWYGDGDLRPNIEDEIKRLGIHSRVELKGRRPRSEVLNGLAKGSIYLSASKWEGIGVANLEASALGCWPFLSKIPPHDEIALMLGFETYPLNDLEKWRLAIIEYLTKSTSIKMDMREMLVNKTLSKFDLEKSVSRYLEVYNELIKK